MNKTLSCMGLMRRAGKLIIGHDAVMLSVRNEKALTVILSSDASKRHQRELEAARFQGKILNLSFTMEEIGFATGKKSCIFAVEDEGFAKAIDKTLSEEGI
ncbi:MAG: ribosomal L7Ae/L30e/S12e/Gadd45 family protein [Clostridia bacterium]|nr:ribosomal L7Ae/L30e/S12e/Gadd45 family protein [Clostridia bacterium]